MAVEHILGNRFVQAFILGIVNLVISLPVTYKLTNRLTGGRTSKDDDGTPKLSGIIIHSVVFTVAAFFILLILSI